MEPHYPINNGFLREPTVESLQPGTVIDRYGTENGRFVSPEGTPISARSLPRDTNTQQLFSYEVIRPLPVQSGTIAPAFGEFGGGIQYLLPFGERDLADAGYLKVIG